MSDCSWQILGRLLILCALSSGICSCLLIILKNQVSCVVNPIIVLLLSYTFGKQTLDCSLRWFLVHFSITILFGFGMSNTYLRCPVFLVPYCLFWFSIIFIYVKYWYFLTFRMLNCCQCFDSKYLRWNARSYHQMISQCWLLCFVFNHLMSFKLKITLVVMSRNFLNCVLIVPCFSNRWQLYMFTICFWFDGLP